MKGERRMIEITKGEAESLCEFLELGLIQYVKDNPDIDSMLWLDNIMSIWRKCGGRKHYADGEEDADGT